MCQVLVEERSIFQLQNVGSSSLTRDRTQAAARVLATTGLPR